METLALVLFLASGMLFRSVAVGRVDNIRQDWHDYASAFFAGDGKALREVAARRGTNVRAVSTAATSLGDAGIAAANAQASGTGARVLAEMKRLAAIANNRYEYGKTGPQSYDCSGLVWRAMVNLGVFTGQRFTTETFANVAPGFARKMDAVSAVPGDVMVWHGSGVQHMGVYVGGDKLYSAYNTDKGILETSVSAVSTSPPDVWRLN